MSDPRLQRMPESNDIFGGMDDRGFPLGDHKHALPLSSTTQATCPHPQDMRNITEGHGEYCMRCGVSL